VLQELPREVLPMKLKNEFTLSQNSDPPEKKYQTVGDFIKSQLGRFFRRDRLVFRLAFYLFLGLTIHFAYVTFASFDLSFASVLPSKLAGILIGLMYGITSLNYYRRRIFGNTYVEPPHPSARRRTVLVFVCLFLAYLINEIIDRFGLPETTFYLYVGIPLTLTFPLAALTWLVWVCRYEIINGPVYIRQYAQ